MNFKLEETGAFSAQFKYGALNISICCKRLSSRSITRFFARR